MAFHVSACLFSLHYIPNSATNQLSHCSVYVSTFDSHTTHCRAIMWSTNMLDRGLYSYACLLPPPPSPPIDSPMHLAPDTSLIDTTIHPASPMVRWSNKVADAYTKSTTGLTFVCSPSVLTSNFASIIYNFVLLSSLPFFFVLVLAVIFWCPVN